MGITRHPSLCGNLRPVFLARRILEGRRSTLIGETIARPSIAGGVGMGDDSNKTASFVSLFAANNRRIYAFVRTFIHNRADADEVFQDTCTALWAKFDQFQPETSFWSWACTVARFEALRFLRRNRLQDNLFSDSFYEAVDQRAQQSPRLFDAQHDTLADCYAKLNADQRALIDRMYVPGGTPKSVASELGRSANSVYKALGRIHGLLFDCIQQQLQEQGESLAGNAGEALRPH